MNKNIKKTLKLIVLFLILITNIKKCYAVTISASGEASDNSNNYQESTVSIKYGLKRIEYTYKRSISLTNNLHLNAYNMDGTSVITDDIIIDANKYSFKSGTWVGINVTEDQTSSWQIKGESTTETGIVDIRRVATCLYFRKVTKTIIVGEKITMTEEECKQQGGIVSTRVGTHRYNCVLQKKVPYYERKKEEYLYDYYDTYKNCPNLKGWRQDILNPFITEKTEAVGLKGIDVEVKEELDAKAVEETKAAARAALGGPIGKIKYIKVNDYPLEDNDCTVESNCYGIITGTSKKGITEGETDGKSYGSFTVKYDYLQEKVCIDIKTSKVTYGRDCNANEIKIKNGQIPNTDITYWHYFIPLNAKSNDDFWIEGIPNGGNTYNINECESIMKTLTNYKEYISPLINGKTFIGDYETSKKNSEDYKLLAQGNGCSLLAKVKFPLSQEFYREDNNYKFKGFNFYYKPIDVNNPFPNGIDQKSLWYEWNQSNNKTPNITKSYNEVTYIARNINTTAIRNYNKNNIYTNWDNIGLNGRSSFIGDGLTSLGIIKRQNENLYQVYKLGCGGKNADPNNKMLYIEGCEQKQ